MMHTVRTQGASVLSLGEPAPGVPGGRLFRLGSCRVIVSRDPAPDLRWHLSISHPTRYPKWDEIKAARMHYIPQNVTMAMYLPGERDYVNVHPNCFHLWESREAA